MSVLHIFYLFIIRIINTTIIGKDYEIKFHMNVLIEIALSMSKSS